MNVKINNKNYQVPQLSFEHLLTMEDQGFSVVEAFQKKQYFLVAMGFVCVVANTERAEAARLIEQHILGGGDIASIIEVFMKAAMESDFFRKILGMTEETDTRKNKKSKKALKEVEEIEETEEDTETTETE